MANDALSDGAWLRPLHTLHISSTGAGVSSNGAGVNSTGAGVSSTGAGVSSTGASVSSSVRFRVLGALWVLVSCQVRETLKPPVRLSAQSQASLSPPIYSGGIICVSGSCLTYFLYVFIE